MSDPAAMRVTPELLAEVGAALFGPQWQRALARASEVNDRHMRKWAAGDEPTPTWLRAALRDLIDKRIGAAAKVRAKL